MPAHRATPSEVLPLKERAHRPTDSTASAADIPPDPHVSPFADPRAAPLNPFADPSPSDLPRAPERAARPRAPTLSFSTGGTGHFAPFSDDREPDQEGLGQGHMKSPLSPGAAKELPPRSPVRPRRGKGGYWDMDGTATRQRRRRLLIYGGVALLLAVIVATVVGVFVSRASRSHSSGPGPLPGTVGAVSFENPSDPSTYVLDGALQNSFYGLDYVPYGAYAPDCQITQNNVTEDIVLLSQLTTRLRLYSAECEQDRMVLEAIRLTGVELIVYLALNLTGNNTGFYEQASEVANSLLTYGTKNVAGVVVGDQFIATYLAAHNTSDPNSQAGQTAAAYVSSEVSSMRATITALNLSAPVAVGTADGGNMFTPVLLQELDFAMASVMPWRNGVPLGSAAQWTTTFFKDYALSTSQATASNPAMYIGETGWPSTLPLSAPESQYPTVSPAALQTFLDSFVCPSNQNGTGYFWYEAFDEAWRQETYGGVEGGWGLFTSA
ncbi:glycoside hydrolase family 17 protein [Calocera cornea HHB12733]|uniref:glucan endo-1,3-beta-D-glucosidase n=1 Tax=Calocera cornea HHB12733 TaxID=1353952 RepID=A0A165DJG1_9BASI|nr:glycoside hydrolase family 17 protein [Calocera cornea HHB12733]